MSYVINKTDNTVLVTLQDGTTNTETGLTLIGRNYTGYGEVQNENFVRLLENFASDKPPGESVGFAPIAGTLWWDTGNQKLRIYNGTSFIPVSPLTESNTAPTLNNSIGDQWWNIANCQLSTWTGTKWQLIGPIYTKNQGKNGPIVETLLDNTNEAHTVVVEYSNDEVVYISSSNTFILLSETYGFSEVQKGINLPGNKVIEGNAFIGGHSLLNSDVEVNGKLTLARQSGSTPVTGPAMVPGTTNFYDIGSPTLTFRNTYTNGVVLSDANVYYNGKSLIVQNTASGGGVEVYVNSTDSGNILASRVDGTSGLMYVSADPVDDLGVATKGYTDAEISSLNTSLTSAIDQTNANLATLSASLNTDITSVLASLQANVNLINANDQVTASSLTTLTNRVADDEASTADNFNTAFADINSLAASIEGLAPLASPTFTGIPTAPTASVGDNSLTIATTAFVAAADSGLATDYNFKITSLTNSVNATITNGLALKANLASPALTGIPTAPTANPGTNSTQIATTAYVTGAIAAQKFNYTVSANPPSGGENGDFWFQIG